MQTSVLDDTVREVVVHELGGDPYSARAAKTALTCNDVARLKGFEPLAF